MTDSNLPFHGDRPIEAPSEDRLGFTLPAEHVAKAVHEMASPDGFVIGVEGEWGSGKSSFINLVSKTLEKFENPPEIIRFLPWLIRSHEGLLKELFTDISKATIKIDVEGATPKGWKSVRAKVWPTRYG